jgi:hypothetical protein
MVNKAISDMLVQLALDSFFLGISLIAKKAYRAVIAPMPEFKISTRDI